MSLGDVVSAVTDPVTSLFEPETEILTDPYSEMISEEMQNAFQMLRPQERFTDSPFSDALGAFSERALSGEFFDPIQGIGQDQLSRLYQSKKNPLMRRFQKQVMPEIIQRQANLYGSGTAEALQGAGDVLGGQLRKLKSNIEWQNRLRNTKLGQTLAQQNVAMQALGAGGEMQTDPLLNYIAMLSGQQPTSHLVQQPSIMSQAGQVASAFV